MKTSPGPTSSEDLQGVRSIFKNQFYFWIEQSENEVKEIKLFLILKSYNY